MSRKPSIPILCFLDNNQVCCPQPYFTIFWPINLVFDFFEGSIYSQYISTMTGPEIWEKSQCSFKPSDLMISQFFSFNDT